MEGRSLKKNNKLQLVTLNIKEKTCQIRVRALQASEYKLVRWGWSNRLMGAGGCAREGGSRETLQLREFVICTENQIKSETETPTRLVHC